MANVIFARGSSTELPAVQLSDGQLLFTIDNGHLYLDHAGERIEFYKKDIDTLITSIADAKKAGTDAQADVDALEAKVGTVPDGETVVGMITDSQYDDTALAARVTANENAITTLNGEGEGSVKKAVTEAIAEVIAEAPEDFDTLKEIADWLASHETDAAAMNTQISANKAAIELLNKDETTEGSVANTVKTAIDALDYSLEAAEGKYIASITQVDGKVSATQVALPVLEWKTFSAATED